MPPREPSRPRLAFYRRLNVTQKRDYDRSDAISTLALAPHPKLGETTHRLVTALAEGKRPAVQQAAQALVTEICERLRPRGKRPVVRVPTVKVLRTRPRVAASEFHGLYTSYKDASSEIRVWMFTAAHRQVVKPRTFLRTLLHEVCHHLDMTLLDLPSSLHTLGFHARESSLVRALERSGASIPGGGRRSAAGEESPRRERPRRAPSVGPIQLELF
jgi:hypothetical protein